MSLFTPSSRPLSDIIAIPRNEPLADARMSFPDWVEALRRKRGLWRSRCHAIANTMPGGIVVRYSDDMEFVIAPNPKASGLAWRSARFQRLMPVLYREHEFSGDALTDILEANAEAYGLPDLLPFESSTYSAAAA